MIEKYILKYNSEKGNLKCTKTQLKVAQHAQGIKYFDIDFIQAQRSYAER